MPDGHNKSRGFSLLELMVVVGIIAILATIVVPSFAQMLNQERLVSATNNMASTFQAARSEAVKRNIDVTLSSVAGRWQAQDNATQELLVLSAEIDEQLTVTDIPELTIASTGGVTVTPPGAMPVEISLANLNNQGCAVITILPSGQLTTDVGDCP